MAVSEMLVKLIGLILAIVGLSLLLSAVGIHALGTSISPLWLELLLGVVFLGAGVWIVRGGNLTL